MQVGKHGAELRGGQHALVDEGARRQADDVGGGTGARIDVG